MSTHARARRKELGHGAREVGRRGALGGEQRRRALHDVVEAAGQRAEALQG